MVLTKAKKLKKSDVILFGNESFEITKIKNKKKKVIITMNNGATGKIITPLSKKDLVELHMRKETKLDCQCNFFYICSYI